MYSWAELHRLLSLSSFPAQDLAPSYNVAPTQLAPIVTGAEGQRSASMARWGFVPTWWKDSKRPTNTINARAESVGTSNMFRSAFNRAGGRCIVPVSGFFEWQVQSPSVAGGKPPPKVPHYITRADGQPIFFAGLHSPNAGDETFTIITCTPNAFMARVHDRMPVILEPESVESWLAAPSPPATLLRPAAEGILQAHPVGAGVNKPANNTSDLIQPARPDPATGLP